MFSQFYKQVVPVIAALVLMLYFGARHLPGVAHFVVIGTFVVMGSVIARTVQRAYQKGYLTRLYNFVHSLMDRAWIAMFLGLEKVNNSVPGKTFLLCAFGYLAYSIGHFLYYNFRIAAILESFASMIQTFVFCFFDSPALLLAFEQGVASIPVVDTLFRYGAQYFDSQLRRSQQGDTLVLFIIPFVFAILFLIAMLFYGCKSLWKRYISKLSIAEVANMMSPVSAHTRSQVPRVPS